MVVTKSIQTSVSQIFFFMGYDPVSIINAHMHTVEPPTMDSPYYRNLHNADKRPQSRIIPHSLLYIVTSILAEISLLRIMDTEVTPQRTKSIQTSL